MMDLALTGSWSKLAVHERRDAIMTLEERMRELEDEAGIDIPPVEYHCEGVYARNTLKTTNQRSIKRYNTCIYRRGRKTYTSTLYVHIASRYETCWLCSDRHGVDSIPCN
jgi:hypothetical protein